MRMPIVIGFLVVVIGIVFVIDHYVETRDRGYADQINRDAGKRVACYDDSFFAGKNKVKPCSEIN